jgi:hypothetical protein
MGSRFGVLKTMVTVRTTKFNIHQDRLCSINVILRCVRVSLVVVETHCVAYSDCDIRSQTVVTYYALRMRRIILSSVASLALQSGA